MNQARVDKIAALYQRANEVGDENAVIEARYGADRTKWPVGQQTRSENLIRQALKLGEEAAELQELEDKTEHIRSLAQIPSNVERTSPDVPSHTRHRSNPWADMGDQIARFDTPTGLRQRALDAVELVADVPTAARAFVTGLLDISDDSDPYQSEQSRATAEYVLAAADPAYLGAFRKVLRDPIHGFLNWSAQEREAYSRTNSVRAAMSLTSGNGGYLVPFTLDPTIVLSNTGALNPWRELCSVKTTATNTWNGVSSAGVNAGWLAEGAEDTDHSPTFGNIAITPQKASAWLYGSYEVLGDSEFASQLPMLLADAKNRLEEAAFATGSGMGQPKGIITAAVAAAKTVATASVATFAAADIYSLLGAVPDRWYANASVVANKSVTLKARQFDTAGGSAFWANLGEGQPERLLGKPYRESSTMAGTLTTASKILLAGDLKQYFIVDRLGMNVLYEPLVKGATERPTGQAGWFAFWRVGGDLAVPDAVRVLNVA